MPLSEEDEQAIDQALQAWRQGDVSLDAGLEVFHLADLTRPHSPASAQFAASLAAAGEAIDAGAEPVRVEVRGVVMLSQTCDVVRGWRCRRTPRRSAPATCRRHVHRACGERRIPGKREDGRVRRRQRGVRVPSRPGRAQPHSSGRYLPFRFRVLVRADSVGEARGKRGRRLVRRNHRVHRGARYSATGSGRQGGGSRMRRC